MVTTTTTVDIVTGASQGIGRAIAEYIGEQRRHHFYNEHGTKEQPYKLVLVGRNVRRGQSVATSIAQTTGLSVVFESCDLSQFQEVQRLREKLFQMSHTDGDDDAPTEYRIGILVNNAAECPQQQQLVERRYRRHGNNSQITTEPVDKQFASNVLGYHFMLHVFADTFSPGTTHVLNVASNWAGDLDLNDLQFSRRKYDNDSAYRQSKQANRMLSKIWSDRLQGIAFVNACHPGEPCTTLSKDLGYNMYSSAPTMKMIASQSPIPYLIGFGKKALNTTGGWYDGSGTTPRTCRFSAMTKEAKELFEICENFCV